MISLVLFYSINTMFGVEKEKEGQVDTSRNMNSPKHTGWSKRPARLLNRDCMQAFSGGGS